MTGAVHRRQLPIHQPCDENFEAMRGTVERRFCQACEHHVHDLSRLTEAEARALVRGPGRVCVRYRVGPDGYIRFKPAKLAGPAAFVAAISLAMAACTPHGEAEGLESPEEAMLCRDASGYAVDCDLASEPVIPSEPAPTETEPPPVKKRDATREEKVKELDEDDWILGFV